MNEYISRGDVLDIVSQYCPDDDGSCSKADVDPREMLDEIEALPTTDVQPVVYCKDCKHRKERHYEESDEKPYIKYECKFTKYSMSDNGFCSFGARIDNNTRGKVNELSREVSRPDGNCLDCKFQYLNNSDYWCSICPGNPEDI